jgi:hypothetical protein
MRLHEYASFDGLGAPIRPGKHDGEDLNVGANSANSVVRVTSRPHLALLALLADRQERPAE